MSRPNENKDAQVDQRSTECLLFAQRMDACLDDRDSISLLVSDRHLDHCSHCRISFDIYRQFDGAGGAVLNGGARTLGPYGKKHSPNVFRRWLPFSSLAMAVVLIVFAVVVAPSGQSENQSVAINSSTKVASENSTVAEVDSLEFDSDAASKLWNSNFWSALSSVAGYLQQQELSLLFEVDRISQRLLPSSLVSSIVGDPGSGWEKPWQYTSELPGIRPFHQSVNVALLLYRDSMTVL